MAIITKHKQGKDNTESVVLNVRKELFVKIRCRHPWIRYQHTL